LLLLDGAEGLLPRNPGEEFCGAECEFCIGERFVDGRSLDGRSIDGRSIDGRLPPLLPLGGVNGLKPPRFPPCGEAAVRFALLVPEAFSPLRPEKPAEGFCDVPIAVPRASIPPLIVLPPPACNPDT